ncbi:hypothetical protein L1887_53697 [Cichorium endivia]|nr:hypothetical protein L1887_53697 [Cichorium endivia]
MRDEGRVGFLLELFVEHAGDEHATNLLGTCAYGVETGVTPESGNGVVVCVAVSAEHLHGFGGDFDAAVGGVEDCACAVAAGNGALVACTADGVDVGAGSAEFGVHVGDLALDQLELGDARAKLLALVRVRHGVIESRLHQSQRSSAKNESFQIETRHKYPPLLGSRCRARWFPELQRCQSGSRTCPTRACPLCPASEAG